jgi:hypothetical protein
MERGAEEGENRLKRNNNYNENNRNSVNPFSPQYPASPEYFVDRKEARAYFTKTVTSSAKLHPPAPTNFIILGEWGVGKTSLLYKLKEIALFELPQIKSFCFHFTLDPTCCRSWDVFSSVLLNQLKQNFEASAGLKKKLRSELSKWNIALSIPPVSIQREKKEEIPSLTDSLELLWKKHLEPSGVDICLLFLDDAHYFLVADQPNAYFTLRNNFQELAWRGCNIALILTGPKLLLEEIVDLAEPFARFFHPFYIEPFDTKGTREAIIKRIKASKLKLQVAEDVISAIHKKTDGHPYFVMFIMYELINAIGAKNRITRKDFEKHWHSIVTTLENNVFKGRLAKVSEKEVEVLIKISMIEEQFVSPSMIKSVKGAPEFFSRLEQKGLLLKKERGQYHLFHPLFKDYLKKYANKA